jgi:hypothetical protein
MSYDAWKTTEPDYLDPGRLRSGDAHPNQYTPHEYCDFCSGDVRHAISLQGVGLFCSRACATQASERHATAMDQVRR